MHTVYLAGPITMQSYGEATDWRNDAITLLHPVKGISPMRGKLFLMGENNKLQDAYDESVSPIVTGKSITRRDHFDCTRVDMVLMNLLGAKIVSIGSMIEVGWASERRIPIILVMEEKGNIHEHCMLRESVDMRFNNLNDAVEAVRTILL